MSGARNSAPCGCAAPTDCVVAVAALALTALCVSGCSYEERQLGMGLLMGGLSVPWVVVGSAEGDAELGIGAEFGLRTDGSGRAGVRIPVAGLSRTDRVEFAVSLSGSDADTSVHTTRFSFRGQNAPEPGRKALKSVGYFLEAQDPDGAAFGGSIGWGVGTSSRRASLSAMIVADAWLGNDEHGDFGAGADCTLEATCCVRF